MADENIDVSSGDHWKAVFDVAVESPYFGSGFLDDEEVAALRAAARELGVDPMAATPRNFKLKYCTGYVPAMFDDCGVCGHYKEHHKQEDDRQTLEGE